MEQVRDERLAMLEAFLLAADEPVPQRKLGQLLELPDNKATRALLARLRDAYRAGASAFRLTEAAGGFELLTDPGLRPWLDRLLSVERRLDLSGAALETLAIVAYRQPINRADLEAVRGVASGELLKQLLDRDLVRVVGKEDTLGRPFLYGTTKTFLREFGLRNLRELPGAAVPPRRRSTDAAESLDADDADDAANVDDVAGVDVVEEE